MRSVLAILLGLSLATGAAVTAAPGKSFDQLDKDNSGALSQSEMTAAVKFSEADADGNGEVSKSEYENAREKGGTKEQGESTY